MNKMKATIKAPFSKTESIMEQLNGLGVDNIEVQTISYEKFVSESRMNYDCVYRQAWEEKAEVAYLNFFFADSPAGREQAYFVEFNLKQIPLNLRYEMP